MGGRGLGQEVEGIGEDICCLSMDWLCPYLFTVLINQLEADPYKPPQNPG